MATDTKDPVPLTRSPSASDRLLKCSVAGDTQGLFEVLSTAQVFSVDSGTPVVRFSGVLTCEVKILEGPLAGKTG